MEIDYIGRELESFGQARNWKSYVQQVVRPHLLGDVAEIGAGIGETTRALRPGATAKSWTCIEPDKVMASRVEAMAARGELGENVRLRCGTLSDLPATELFNCIIYIDVLEHIAEDREELALATTRLRSGGHLVVLSPAFPVLYSEFDRAIGHYRRYTKSMLRAIAPRGLRVIEAVYLDSLGFLASAANRLLLGQALPGNNQLLFWDRMLVPVSRFLDPILGHAIGRSILMVWHKP